MFYVCLIHHIIRDTSANGWLIMLHLYLILFSPNVSPSSHSIRLLYLPSSLTLLEIPILISRAHHDTLFIGGRHHSRSFVTLWKLHTKYWLFASEINRN